MTKTKKILLYSAAAIFTAFVILMIFLIGITTDFSSDKIEDSEIAKCKEFVNIIKRNENNINQKLTEDAAGDGACIRYLIETSKDIDRLFSKISSADKQRLKELVDTRFSTCIEIGEAKNCIMFDMKTSRNNWSIIGKYKKLFLIYELNPTCNCKDNPIGAPNYPQYVKKLSENWYLVKVQISKRYLHG